MQFSQRFPADLSASPLMARLAAMPGLLDLTESNPTRVGFMIPELASHFATSGCDRYEPNAQGLLATRQAVAGYLATQGLAIAPTELLLTASTSEAYGLLLKLLCNPGDKIAALAPSYPLMDVLAALEGVQVLRYRLEYRKRWALDLDSVREVLDQGARAVVVVQPNNPTGSCLNADELSALASLCAEHEAALISDEVFRPFGRTAALPSLANAQALTFVLDGLSKGLALPQLKLGWIAVTGPQALVSQALPRLEWIADAYLSVSTPVQLAAPALLRHAEPVQAALRERVWANRERLAAALQSCPAVEQLAAEGGWYAVLRVPQSHTEEELVLGLAEHARVLVQPGFFYDFARDGYLVVSLIPAPKVFGAALPRLVAEFGRLFG